MRTPSPLSRREAAPRRAGSSRKEPFATLSCPAFRAAVQSVYREWSDGTVHSPVEAEVVEALLIRIATHLESGLSGKEYGAHRTREDRSSLRLQRRLVTAIRKDVMNQWSTGLFDVEDVRFLELLTRIEDLAAHLLPEDEGSLSARLSKPDAFELVTEVAHDLRSPLTSILFLADALQEGHSGELSLHQKRQMGLIYSAALGLVGISNDLMTMAGGQTADPFDEEPIPFSMHEVFDSVYEMVAPMAEAKGLSLDFKISCYDHRMGYPGPLGRVLLNLTTNAVKFTETGIVRIRATAVGRSAVEVSVHDSGRGIAEEHRERLFDPFQKSEGRSGYFFATSGLGLSIVRRLVFDMDSELRIESEVGKGTRFFFELHLPEPR